MHGDTIISFATGARQQPTSFLASRKPGILLTVEKLASLHHEAERKTKVSRIILVQQKIYQR
jgi:hypothetical protein